MVTVYTYTGASLTISNELAKEFSIERGGPPVSPDFLDLIRQKHIEIKAKKAEVRTVEKRLEAPLPLADELTEVVLVNQASLP